MKIKLLSVLARMLGIQFKVNGTPYGAEITNCAESHLTSQRNSSYN